VKKPLINKEKMNKKEFKVSESIPTLPSFLKHCSAAFFCCIYPIRYCIFPPMLYCMESGKKGSGRSEKPLILNGSSVLASRVGVSVFSCLSFVIWLLFLLRFYHRKVCSEYAVTKCRTCSNHCVKMSHKQ